MGFATAHWKQRQQSRQVFGYGIFNIKSRDVGSVCSIKSSTSKKASFFNVHKPCLHHTLRAVAARHAAHQMPAWPGHNSQVFAQHNKPWCAWGLSRPVQYSGRHCISVSTFNDLSTFWTSSEVHGMRKPVPRRSCQCRGGTSVRDQARFGTAQSEDGGGAF